ncbi:MAG: fluoride efflux transporter CrcB [Phycisphaerales bacterium]|nr:fluoride efflux transporter CrcB [Phycisphaerales bacterium]
MIFIGSGLGGLARYLVGGWVQKSTDALFPIGTLVVNFSGCLFAGFLAAIMTERVLIREEYRAAVLIGVLGGYTTFSTFGLETFALLNDGQFGRAALNVAMTVLFGVAAVWLGYRVAQSWWGA